MIDFIISNFNILADCGIFGEDMYNLLSKLYNAILIAVPCLVLILCSVDMAKAVIAQDEKAMKEAQSNAIKRIIAGVAVFFIPIVVNVILGYVTGVPLGSTCGIELQ